MPRYDYGCAAHGIFEAFAGVNDSETPCPVCREPARRRPFSGAPYLRGATVPRQIPDASYRQEAEQRHLRETWGTAERSIEAIRHNTVTDNEGNRRLDVAGVTRETT